MKCYLGLGSNLSSNFNLRVDNLQGNPFNNRLNSLLDNLLNNLLNNLDEAAAQIKALSSAQFLRASTVYETKALVPPNAPKDWDKPFYNAVVEIEWESSLDDLLQATQQIEKKMGRGPGEKWAPRVIDIDILIFGDVCLQSPTLQVPHGGIWERSFVLEPLKELCPQLILPNKKQSILQRSRDLLQKNKEYFPRLMGIFNLTPDSFSEGVVSESLGSTQPMQNFRLLDSHPDNHQGLNISLFQEKLNVLESCLISYIDLGGESTRPGAGVVTPEQEWERLKPALDFLRNRYQNKIFRPKISVDTRHPWVANQSLKYSVDCLNDVSGLADLEMIKVLQTSGCDYVLMHSLTVPASKEVTLSDNVDPVREIKEWFFKKLELLTKNGISSDRIIFDPGIGFGKTAKQSIELLARVNEFFELPVRILIGHSRKSFINHWGERPAGDRDIESIAISLELCQQGVDILRVHQPDLHFRAMKAYQGVKRWSV